MKVVNKLENYSDDLSNSISISNGAKASALNVRFMESGSSIVVGVGCDLTDSEIVLAKNSRLVIGPRSILKGKISIGSFSSVEIGSDLSVTKNLYIRVVERTKVTIGNDCLVATNVVIRTNDGHPIYDTKTRLRINESRDVKIGEHVWLGDEAAILKGVTIGDGSIVAMRSVVTKDVPSKTLVAGIPAKPVRKDCTWEHNLSSHTERFYD